MNKEEIQIIKSRMNTKKKKKGIMNKTTSMKNEIVMMKNKKIMNSKDMRETSIGTNMSKATEKITENMNKRLIG